MNTATIVAAALLGYTWGYHPLDERSTEFLIQMSPADIEFMEDGQSEILVDLPAEAGPVGRIRVIVGNERLPRESLPPSDLGDERTAARPTQPAIAFGPDRDSANTAPNPHSGSPGFTTPEPGVGERYGNLALPPALAPLNTNPHEDRHTASVPADDVVPPPLGGSGLEDRSIGLDERPHDPFGHRHSITEGQGVVDAPAVTSPEAYRPGGDNGLPLDGTSGRSPVVTNVGPSLTLENGRNSFDSGNVAEPPSRPAENDVGPSTNPPNGSLEQSPSESGRMGVEQRQRFISDTTTDWRSWTLVTGPVAFGLFWLNLYQWGTYKSIRQRYLSLLRRTGEV